MEKTPEQKNQEAQSLYDELIESMSNDLEMLEKIRKKQKRDEEVKHFMENEAQTVYNELVDGLNLSWKEDQITRKELSRCLRFLKTALVSLTDKDGKNKVVPESGKY